VVAVDEDSSSKQGGAIVGGARISVSRSEGADGQLAPVSGEGGGDGRTCVRKGSGDNPLAPKRILLGGYTYSIGLLRCECK
jgi:hypothetical protein